MRWVISPSSSKASVRPTIESSDWPSNLDSAFIRYLATRYNKLDNNPIFEAYQVFTLTMKIHLKVWSQDIE